ncbi:hypothetical protein [Epilithonimonas sp. UC225_85]|uniref:hypothetical protein n=1 Tax=Epilithonimonas sp. UC225_85 TaxID=3350167 RepID=UPI0036D266AC
MNLQKLIFILFSVYFSAQKNEVCQSSEMSKYDEAARKKWEHYKFVPISKDQAIIPPFEFVKVEFLYDYAKYEDVVDSMNLKLEKYRYLLDPETPEINKTSKSKKNKKDTDSYMDNFDKYMKIEDSLRKIEFAKKIGPLSRPEVIKSERKDNKWAILYYDFKYDELLRFGAGYWLAFSSDNGKTWRYNYTGLSEKNNFVFKSNSKQPLWKDDNHIQIEADIIRMTDPMGHPLPPEYEVVRDNALVIMDINEILKDSDNDGLNDITEKKLLMNPNSADTDNDGIPDGEDTNPRFKSDSNEFTILYEGLMYGNYEMKGRFYPGEFDIDISNPKLISKSDIQKNIKDSEIDSSKMEDVFSTVSFIVTDDENLQQINPPNNTVIVMTEKEYEEYKKQNNSQLIKENISPLFQCDKAKDTFILRKSASYSGETYKIIRTKKGWKVKTVSSWIS